jgi:type VI secretion system secreted protein VgrG
MALITGKPFVFNSPLKDKLLFLSMQGTEQLGRTFGYTVHLLSPDPDIVLTDLIGQKVSVSVELTPQEAKPRYFHAHVIHFQREGKLGDYFVYSAHLAPWLWLLSYAADCRIFQNASIPDIVMAVFRQHAISDFSDSRLTGIYPKLDYVTQYDESDLAFVSRLMEDAGIYYYFEHEKDKHTLVLADSYSAHHKADGYEEIPLLETKIRGARTTDYIDRWSRWNDLRPGAVVMTDYDFEKPRVPLEAQRVAPNNHDKADFEVYQYPGNYNERSAGEDICRRRLDEFNATYEQMGGSGNIRGLGVGNLFDLVIPPPAATRHEYLVDYASYDLRVGGYETKASVDNDNVFSMQFTVLDSKRQFRPERRFKPKKMPGPQTATVVGKSGEEIWTDKYGRVKVQFHWDRKGKNDENSSCWIRVAQVWAGKQWGAMHIPRIGQEVIVDYLNGDPDRPIITGRLYNADNMPPYDLPANQTQSGIKSRSSKGGTANNFNEIRFEDLKGKEELHIQAELDMSTNVKRNQTLYVGGDQNITIHGNQTTSVHGTDEKTGKKLPVQSVTTVTGKHTFDASDTIKIQAPTSITLECGGSTIVMVPGKITLTAGGGATIVLDANVLAQSNPGAKVLLDANVLAQSLPGAKVVLDANVLARSVPGAQVVLDANVAAKSVPGSELTLDASATLSGTASATVQGKADATLTAGGGTVKTSSAGVAASGPKVDIAGSGMVSIAGGIVKIN